MKTNRFIVTLLAATCGTNFAIFARRTLIAALTLLAGPALAAPGDVDPTFIANTSLVNATAEQPDGKILIGGLFTSVAGVARSNFARLNADGTLDSAFNPAVSSIVNSIAVQTDGKIVLGGLFGNVGGSTRNFIARLNADGTVDSGFNPDANNEVWSLALQADGKILLGGYFTSVGGSARNRIARLNANGTVDSAFNPNANDLVYSVAVQADGKVLLAGGFTSVAATARNYVARLNANGTIDSAFNPNADNHVSNVAVQADGKVLLCGYFTTLGGTARNRLARVNADGTLDSAFNPNADSNVFSVAVQADGKVLLGGYFTTIGGIARNRIARVNANGTLDSTFNPDADSYVSSVAVQADGKVLLGGGFSTVGGIARSGFARLVNDPATETLNVPGANRVEWLRGGASPEVEQVTFELSTDGGNTYSAIGAGTRIAGGWERTGLSLPAGGEIRARGRSTGGKFNSSSGLMETLTAFGSASPEIAVEQPPGTDIADGGSTSFGSVGVGDSASLTFIIKNTGTASLTGLAITMDGPDQGMFAVTASPGAPVPGNGSTTFTVRFAPTGTVGIRSATLHIANNDSDENPFDLTLTGTGVLSTNADLAALSMSAGTLTPLFASATTSYAATINSGTSSTAVTPTASGSAATISVNGVAVTSGSASAPIGLNVGANTLSIVVTAGDGVSTKTYTVTVTRPAPGTGAGDLDTGFNANASVYATAVQPDGKILLSGPFSTVAGTPRNHFARLNPDGTLDSAFNPNVNAFAQTLAVQADGKVLIGGQFTSVAGGVRNNLARLNADGTLDSAFNPNANADVNVLALQADGKVLVGGYFTTVGGIVRNRVARLNANGTLDSTFNPNVNGPVFTLAVQADGKVLIGGEFTSVGGIARNYLVRLNPNGTLDNAFNYNPSTYVYSVVVQADGKLLLGGRVRLNTDGTLDSAFNPNSSASSVAVQADGKLLLGGSFTTVGGVARNRMARINADGTLESAFDPNVGNSQFDTVYSVALQADGRVLLGGAFDIVGGIARSGFARLINDPATQALTIPSANRVEWLRGGASPEVEQVSFELSTDGGNTYSALGAGTRIAGGWEKTGLSLPASGEIRARGRTTGGQRNGSSGLVETLAAFGSAAPEIAAEQPPGADIADGGSTSFGNVAVGDAASLTFTIKNTGTASLTGLTITKDGPDQGMFTVTASPVAPVGGAGSMTTFTIRFAPTGTGIRTAALHIANNDADENPFDIALTGTSTLSTNADLAALSLSAGTLMPAFASATASYAATVGYNAITITVTPVAQSTAAITINGIAVASGSASAPIGLIVGENILSIVVTAGDGVSTKTYTVTVTRAAAGPGDVDLAFNPDVDQAVATVAIQPDGKVILGGYFDNVGGIERNRVARLHADGTLDSAFNPNVAGIVNTSAVQADGKVIVGGEIYTVGGIARNNLARLNATGTLDTDFNPNVNGGVRSVAVQADGKILIGGEFTSVAGTARNYIARLNANGTLDTAFNPNANSTVDTVAVQADGKVLLGGSFTTVGGIARNYVARVNANGTLDTAFNPNANSTVFTLAVQADGKVLLGGGFTTIGGTARNYVARVNANGTLDSAFNPNANSSVSSVALQADGRVLLGGGFTTIGGTARNYVARVNANGTLDSTFNPNANDQNGQLFTLAVQADGKVLLGGGVNLSVGGIARRGLARVINDPATQSLTVPSVNRVEWLRGGASPEVEQVAFELSADGGNTYSALGAATRIAGGWEKTGLSLPVGGEIRARGRTTNGGDGSGLVETLAAFGSAAPEIVVEQPPGTDLADGGSTSFGDVAVGDAASLTFTIKNTGTASLTGLTITKDGTDAARFTITASPIPPLPGGGSTSFTVRFTPTGTGARTATLHIASNDSDENPFDLTLTATGTLSANADLAALSLSAGTLTPVFASDTTSYGASVASYVSEITVTPIVAQPTATIAVNGVTVASGSPSGPISLSVGSNDLLTVVTAGDGVTTRTYTITVTRALPAPGDVDGEFDPNANQPVYSLAVQPDGKIVIGGHFFAVGGLPRSGLARLLADGTVESTATFNPGDRADGGVFTVAVQTDGKILVGGAFNNPIARLNADGTVEDAASFDVGLGPDGPVFGMALQADSKILVGGGFTAVNGQPRSRIARLHANGAVEDTATFNPGTGADGNVYSVAVQADGKILLGGSFTTVNGEPRNRIARLNTDGTLESTATFNPGTGANVDVLSVAVQADGKILLGGFFNSVNGQTRNGIARLNTDGTLESTATFNPGTGANGGVVTVAVQADGKILLGGSFNSVNGQPRGGIARLNNDGSVESTATFNPGTGSDGTGSVNGVALQADGKILLAGSFFRVNGQPRNYLARLINDAATQSLTIPDSTRVQWARSGAAPEVEQVTFELSTDGGNTFSALGAATRISGGWEKTGLSLPASGQICARGQTKGGFGNGSSGLIEQVTAFGSYTPFQQWKLTHLGDADAPDLGDPDSDGLRTLAEYGLNLLPERPDGAPFTVTRFTYAEGERLRVFIQREPAHNDVTIEVQAADSPAGSWTVIATSTLGAPFSGPGYVGGDDATPGVKTVEIRDTVNIADAPARFLRAEVKR